MLRSILLASLLFPGVARAEFMVHKASDVRAPGRSLQTEPLTVDYILDKIQRTYMPRMRRCYNKGLAGDATLAGKVTLTFTVNSYGRVDGVAEGVTPKVDACMSAAVGAWRFRTTTARKPVTFRMSVQLQN